MLWGDEGKGSLLDGKAGVGPHEYSNYCAICVDREFSPGRVFPSHEAVFQGVPSQAFGHSGSPKIKRGQPVTSDFSVITEKGVTTSSDGVCRCRPLRHGSRRSTGTVKKGSDNKSDKSAWRRE
jgi:hypothetical protein